RLLRWQMAGITAIAFLVLGAVIALTATDPQARAEIAGTAFICTLYFGAAYLFLSCLKQFSPALQSTYRLFTLGFIVGAFTVIINLVITILYTDALSPWGTLWPVTLGFPVSYLLFYFASRRLALLQEVKSWTLNWKLVLASCLLLTGLFAGLPHGRALYELDGIPGALCFFNVLIIVCYNWALFKAWQQSSERYKYSTRALTISTLTGLFGWVLMAGRTFVDTDTAVLLSNISNLFTVCALIFLLRAGYMLNKLSRE
ncbi:MAG TPA: hypothetical protein VLF62_00570, partial [Candidatus Saccharimonadales bacterium]|nr:hypothetical protein [Candidatus Saccharimonadales bacterium]